MKVKLFMNAAQIISSLTVTLSFLPLPSIAADAEVLYTNCTELQAALNNRNPRDRYWGFEKANIGQNRLGSGYIRFCNGGVIKDGDAGTICRGYIGYSFEPYPRFLDHNGMFHDRGGIAHYYGTWGKTNGSPNSHETGQGKYCKFLK